MQKKTAIIEITLLLFLAVTFFGFWKYTFATYEVIEWQNTQSSEGSGYIRETGTRKYLHQLGTGHDGILTGLQIKTKAVKTSAGDTESNIRLYSIDGDDPNDLAKYFSATTTDSLFANEQFEGYFLDIVQIDGNDTTIATTYKDITDAGGVPTAIDLEPDRYYWLVLDTIPTDTFVHFYGITDFSYINGTPNAEKELINSAYYMQFFGYEDIHTNINTRILAITNPLANSTQASTTVTFEYTYYYGDTNDVDIAGYQLNDVTNGFTYNTLEKPILASGESTFIATSTLVQGNFYLWRPYLRDSITNTIQYTGSWTSFGVIEPLLYPGDYINPITGEPISTSTPFWQFLNVPELLKTKAPTGYVYQYGSMLLNLEAIEATSTPVFTLPLSMASSSLPGVADIEFFSTNTIQELMPVWFINLARTLMVATLWIAFVFALLHKSENMFS